MLRGCYPASFSLPTKRAQDVLEYKTEFADEFNFFHQREGRKGVHKAVRDVNLEWPCTPAARRVDVEQCEPCSASSGVTSEHEQEQRQVILLEKAYARSAEWCDKPMHNDTGDYVNRHSKSKETLWLRHLLQSNSSNDIAQIGYRTPEILSGNACDIEALCKNGQLDKVVLALLCMDHEGTLPSVQIYKSILQACTKSRALAEAKWVYAHLVKHGMECNKMLGDLVVITLVNCGGLEDALRVFCSLPHRSVFSWTAIIAGYSSAGKCREALSCYECMQEDSVAPDKYTFVSLLKTCSKIADIGEGRRIHADAVRHGVDLDIYVGSTLVSMYAKCGSIVDAQQVFDGLFQRDIVSWNAMLTAYAQQGQGINCLQIYSQMREEGVVPNARTFVSVIQACGTIAERGAVELVHGQHIKAGVLQKAREIHAGAIRLGFISDVFIGNSLVSMYAKCGTIEDAEHVFIGLSERDLVSWSAMLAAYAQQQEGEKALQIYERMHEEGVTPDAMAFVSVLLACGTLAENEEITYVDGRSVKVKALQKAKEIYAGAKIRGFALDEFVGSAAISLYAKCGSILDAEEVFELLPERNLVSWNAMLAAYAQEDSDGGKGLQIYQQMQEESIEPDEVTYLSAIEACGNLGSLENCLKIHQSLTQTQPDVGLSVATSLIHSYSKCGCMVAAQRVFDSLPRPDVVSWNALITGYSRVANCEMCVSCYQDMVLAGNRPDTVTFSALLYACSHSGLVNEGLEYFDSMVTYHGINPEIEHYVCIIDLVARAGFFSKAESLISQLPVKPNLTIWVSVLGACRKHGNVLLGRQAFNSALQLDPKHAAAYVLMSNIYSHAGLWDSVKEVQELRRAAGAWRKTGESLVEHEQQVHTFEAADTVHKQAAVVHETLRQLSLQLKESLALTKAARCDLMSFDGCCDL